MHPQLKAYLVKHFGLDENADEKTAKELLSKKLQSGELDTDTYTQLLQGEDVSPKDKASELAASIAEQTATSVASALSPSLESIAKALSGKQEAEENKNSPDGEGDTKSQEGTDASSPPTPEEEDALLKKMEEQLADKYGLNRKTGTDGSELMKMAQDVRNDSPEYLRVKDKVEQFEHTPTALCYRTKQAEHLGLKDKPQKFNGKEVNLPTERTKMLSAVWFRLQVAPEQLKESEWELIHWTLHNEKFHVPNPHNRTDARRLTQEERHRVLEFNKNFYTHGYQKALIDDSSSGGENAIPEFFDMDMIVTPTLASENIVSFVNVVPVPRGTAAQNFIIGRPTYSAANTEGSAASEFSTTGFITNHDTSFFRAASWTKFGINFLEDAHPGLMDEVRNQYMNSAALWFNEQIMGGDGTTEPQGILNASGTADITPGTPTTGPVTITDVLNVLFGVGKAHRFNGGLQNAIYAMTDQRYKAIRQLATGVTGDTRLVFGMNINDYMMFGQPVLIEENALGNNHIVFFQGKGYRLYLRQGVRFIRESGGETLVTQNATIIYTDLRAGGQLDEGAYAGIIDGLSTSP